MPFADATWKRRFRRRLLDWFDKHHRDLPWRGASTPYHIWVSEIMLQQTQVATVVPYFQRFIKRFPNVRQLAAADEREVLQLWEGLGYYRRARQLHQAARRVVEIHSGKFPEDFEAVRALPGIGRYTAGAILSIAFDRRHPILEANTIRLFSRLLAYDHDPTKAAGQRVLWSFAETLLPRSRPGAFNQALMELGSTVCTPRSPQCNRCPVAPLCEAHRLGREQHIPSLKEKKSYEQITEAAIVLWNGDHVLLRRCQEHERWAGMWDFPRLRINASTDSRHSRPGENYGRAAFHERQSLLKKCLTERFGWHVASLRHFTTLKHGVTRFRITLECYHGVPENNTNLPRKTSPASSPSQKQPDVDWVIPAKLTDYPLNVTARKVAGFLALGERASERET